jgi:hypothetical protein
MKTLYTTYGDVEVKNIQLQNNTKGIEIKDTVYGGSFKVQGYDENITLDQLEDVINLYCD